MATNSRNGTPAARAQARRRLRALSITLVTAGVLALALAAATFAVLPRQERILPGVSVQGVALGGQTCADARRALDRLLTDAVATRLTLTAASAREEVTLGDLGVQPDVDAVVAQAYGIGRDGKALPRVMQALLVRRNGLPLPPTFTWNRQPAQDLLQRIAAQVACQPADASAHWDDAAGKVVIDPGRMGGQLNVDKSLEHLAREIVDRLPDGLLLPETVALPYEDDAPPVTAQQLAPIDSILATFTTSYASSTRDRATNVDNAAAAINGLILQPGEVFSFNATVGPRTVARGFRTAPVIVNGQLEPGIGGGICQVSSTVYNAALLANLQIVQRSHHSMPVQYVPSGRDATVAWDALDLKFRNSTETPIIIEAKTGGRRLTARILGKGPAPVVTIERSGISRLSGHSITKKDPSLPAGKRVVESGGGGLAVTVTRVVGGVREVISRDRYIGEPTIVRIGTGAAASPAPAASNSSATAIALPDTGVLAE